MKKLAEAGSSRVDSEFSWDMIAKRTEEVYDEALALAIGSRTPLG
jgi:glycosyltransferase involved in cell wall biosynthesis